MKAVFAAGSANVGDELNEWIWPALLGDIECEGASVLGIGTLLNKDFCRRLADAKKILVMGTGAGYGPLPSVDERWSFHAVRGLRTAQALGLDADRAVADSAYLLATLDWPQLRQERGDVVVIPHHRSLNYVDWQTVCKQAGARFVSPLLPAAEFMQALAGARLVLTEAMHGAILADIVRVPWRGFAFGGQFNADKWLDWAEMFNLDPQIHTLPGFYDPALHGKGRPTSYHLGKLFKFKLGRMGLGRSKWARITVPSFRVEKAQNKLARQLKDIALLPGMLSADAIMTQRVNQLYERLDQLRAELEAPPGTRLKGNPQAFLRDFAPKNSSQLGA